MADGDSRIKPGQAAAIGLLVAIVAIDLWGYLARYEHRFLEWPTLGIIALCFFVAFGERITRLAFDPATGFTLEQAIRRFDDLSDFVADVFQQPRKDNVAALLLKVKSRDIWTRLLIYRIVLRAVLREFLSK